MPFAEKPGNAPINTFVAPPDPGQAACLDDVVEQHARRRRTAARAYVARAHVA
jgi:hypothetical protein